MNGYFFLTHYEENENDVGIKPTVKRTTLTQTRNFQQRYKKSKAYDFKYQS